MFLQQEEWWVLWCCLKNKNKPKEKQLLQPDSSRHWWLLSCVADGWSHHLHLKSIFRGLGDVLSGQNSELGVFWVQTRAALEAPGPARWLADYCDWKHQLGGSGEDLPFLPLSQPPEAQTKRNSMSLSPGEVGIVQVSDGDFMEWSGHKGVSEFPNPRRCDLHFNRRKIN